MGKKIKNSDEFLKLYLPSFNERYPINMRVSEEEKNLILDRRCKYRIKNGEWVHDRSTN